MQAKVIPSPRSVRDRAVGANEIAFWMPFAKSQGEIFVKVFPFARYRNRMIVTADPRDALIPGIWPSDNRQAKGTDRWAFTNFQWGEDILSCTSLLSLSTAETCAFLYFWRGGCSLEMPNIDKVQTRIHPQFSWPEQFIIVTTTKRTMAARYIYGLHDRGWTISRVVPGCRVGLIFSPPANAGGNHGIEWIGSHCKLEMGFRPFQEYC